MAKRINIVVNGCFECPYYHCDELGWVCAKSDKLLELGYIERLEPNQIRDSKYKYPKWCELEEYMDQSTVS